jgi:tRNA (guanine37-N1)-methyltransferase
MPPGRSTGAPHFDILTIFPRYFDSPLAESLLGRAIDRGLARVAVYDMREWADPPHRKVDDEPYGGGAGMVMMAPVVARAIEAVRGDPPGHTVLLTPSGRRFDQASAVSLARRERILLVCGRYEGIDERVAEEGLFDEEISLGDFVLSGGEAAALAIVEAVLRLVPGFVKEYESVENDSFFSGQLDYPHYTRPAVWRGREVPAVLLSGHHAEILRWRRERAAARTRERRPDLSKNRADD